MKILTGQAAQQYRASGQPFLPANQNSPGAPSLTSDASNIGSNSNYQLGTRLRQFGQSPIEQLLLGVTKPFRGIASQAVQLGQGVGDIIGQLGQGKSLNDALANTNISDRSGMFMSGDEQQMAKENPLLMGAQNVAGLAAYGVGGPSTTLIGALGKGALSGALGGFSAANKVEEMPETMLAGAGMGALISGGMYGIGKANQGMKSNRLKQQGNLALSDMTDEQVDNFFTSNDILKNSDIFPDQYQVEAKNTLKSMIDKNNRLVTALDDDVLSKLDDGSLFGNSNMTLSELKNKYSNAMLGFAGDVEDKIGTRVTADDFQAYEQVRQSGATNMWDIRNVEELSGLDRNKIKDIMKNYGKYKNQFGIEKFNVPNESALNDVEYARNMALQYRKMGGNEEMIKRYETDMINSFKQLDSTSRRKILSNLNDELDNLPSKVDYSEDYIDPDILDYQYRMLEKEHRNLINSSIPKSRVVPVDKTTPADEGAMAVKQDIRNNFKNQMKSLEAFNKNSKDFDSFRAGLMRTQTDGTNVKDYLNKAEIKRAMDSAQAYQLAKQPYMHEDEMRKFLQDRGYFSKSMEGVDSMVQQIKSEYAKDLVPAMSKIRGTIAGKGANKYSFFSGTTKPLENAKLSNNQLLEIRDYLNAANGLDKTLKYGSPEFNRIQGEMRNMLEGLGVGTEKMKQDQLNKVLGDLLDAKATPEILGNTTKKSVSQVTGGIQKTSENNKFWDYQNDELLKLASKFDTPEEFDDFVSKLGFGNKPTAQIKETIINSSSGAINADKLDSKLMEGGKTYFKTVIDPKELKIDEVEQIIKEIKGKKYSNTPIIVGRDGYVIDGRHRAVSAINSGKMISGYVPAKEIWKKAKGINKMLVTDTIGKNALENAKLSKNQLLEIRDYLDAVNGLDKTLKYGSPEFNRIQGEMRNMLEGFGVSTEKMKQDQLNKILGDLLDAKVTPEILGNTTKTGKPTSIVKEEYVLESLNPTGTVFTEYTPEIRANAKLGKNMTTLDKTMGKSPNETITIYRGVPSSKYKNINAGDFITTNKQLAKDYAGTGIVLEKKVKLSDILDDKTNPLGEEYIYRPNTKVLGTNKGIEVERYDSEFANKDGVFFSPRGKGSTDFGNVKTEKIIYPTKVLTTSDQETAMQLLFKPKKVEQMLEKYEELTFAEPTGFKAFAYLDNEIANAAKKKGYDAIHYLGDRGLASIDQLSGENWHILDKSIIKDKINHINETTNIINNSNNAFNAEFERITKTYKGQELQTKLKEFLKTLPTDDPIAKSIRSVSKNLFNV